MRISIRAGLPDACAPRKAAAQPGYHLAHLHGAGHRLVPEVGEVVGVPPSVQQTHGTGAAGRSPDERRGTGVDRQGGVVHASELLGARVHVHERLPRRGDRDQGVATRGHLAEPRADHQQQVGRLHALDQRGIGREAQVAHVARTRVVEEVLAAERRHDRQGPRFGEGSQVLHVLKRPAAAPDHGEGALRPGEQPPEGGHVPRVSAGHGASVRFGVGDRHDVPQLGIASVCLRIFSSFPEPADRRMLWSYLSFADCVRLVEAALTAPRVDEGRGDEMRVIGATRFDAWRREGLCPEGVGPAHRGSMVEPASIL